MQAKIVARISVFLRSYGGVIAALSLFLGAMTAAESGASPAEGGGCGADGAEYKDWDGPNGPDQEAWGLACSGGCDSSANCEQREGEDAQGPFKYCGCGDAEKHWPNRCCSTVLRKEGASWAPHRWGTCPPCPSMGACFVVGTSTEQQAACVQ